METLAILAVLSLILSQCLSLNVTIPTTSLRRPGLSNRIVGGYTIDIKDAPYIVSLQAWSHICGGSIISERWILTAAHCTLGQHAHILKIRAGSTTHAENGTLIDVSRIVRHPNFSLSPIDYDFSLLELATNITFGSTMQPIKLPKQDEQYPDDTPSIVTGWGDTQSAEESNDRLRSIVVPIVNQKKCSDAFGGIVTDRMICAGFLPDGGKSPCYGDSGGPLTTDGTLIGLLYEKNADDINDQSNRRISCILIGRRCRQHFFHTKDGSVVSWGVTDCTHPGYPAVFSRVAAIRTWIRANTLL